MGSRIKKLMLSEGIDIRQLAKRSGISERRLASIMLADGKTPTEDEIIRLAVALATDRSEIEGRKKPENELDNRIRWQLTMSGRPDLFDEVKSTIDQGSTNYRGAEKQPISDLAIRTLINQILDAEDPRM
jgi:transcriptional regulator with XRE-family HTH domain